MSSFPRRAIYGLLIVLAVGSAAGRLLSTQRVSEPVLPSKWPEQRPKPSPTFSSNDRSRWATVRALVDEGTFVIGRRDAKVVYGTIGLSLSPRDPLSAAAAFQAGYYLRTRPEADTGIIFEDGYQSVDKVLHPARLEFYSSKPPLLATLIAGLYWVLQSLFGWTLADDPFAVVRTILLLVNIVPFVLYLQVLSRLADRFGRTDWGRCFMVGAAGFATLVTPFLITLNNHTLGTFAVLFTMACVIRIWDHAAVARGGLGQPGVPGWHLFAGAGLLSAFAVTNELPALSFAVAVFCLLAWWFPARTLLFFVPPAAALGASLIALNVIAIGQVRPAYAEFGGPWYEYEGSHWRKPPPGQIRTGIDWAYMRESRAEYAFHVLLGHHGLFSLTPLWLLSAVAMAGGLIHLKRNWRTATGPPTSPPGEESLALPWFVAPLTLALTVVVVGFYLVKSNNYGGNTNGLRWLMWLTPLWLLCLLPVVDSLGASRGGRWLCNGLLAVSLLTAHYSPWNPWRPPWLWDLMIALGWPGY